MDARGLSVATDDLWETAVEFRATFVDVLAGILRWRCKSSSGVEMTGFVVEGAGLYGVTPRKRRTRIATPLRGRMDAAGCFVDRLPFVD
jgi:hypothetical protein